jgi:glycosyltransferase involved in cell wall biosynthesis
MIFYDISSTSHLYVNTGVQRVTRKIYFSLKDKKIFFVPIVWDPFQKKWRKIDSREKELIEYKHDSKLILNSKKNKRSPQWTIIQKIKGIILKFFKKKNKYSIEFKKNDYFFLPEIPNKHTINGIYKIIKFNPLLKKIAIVHDMMPFFIKEADNLCFNQYIRILSLFNGIIVASDESKNKLFEVWNKTIKKKVYPKVIKIHFGNDLVLEKDTLIKKDKTKFFLKNNLNLNIPIILYIASLEYRKNHLELMKASKRLWNKGIKFQLVLIGYFQRKTGRKILNEINKLKNMKYPIKWVGHISDEMLKKYIYYSYFSVFPSLYEGFGLPLIESLFFKKPCICTTGGALKELSKGGGCLVTKGFSSFSIEQSIRDLILNKNLYLKLKREIENRKFKSWKEYSKEVLEFIKSL